MKYSEFVKHLKSLGARIEDGTNHLKVYYNGKQTTCPRHPSKEISNAFAAKIKKQIGLK